MKIVVLIAEMLLVIAGTGELRRRRLGLVFLRWSFGRRRRRFV